MSKKKLNDVHIIHENSRVIDPIKDTFLIQKECRESYYYLCSLKNLLISTIIIDDDQRDANKDTIKNFEKRSIELIDKFQKLEDKDYIKQNNLKEVAITSPTSYVCTTIDIYKLTCEYLFLKPSIDELQEEILEFLCYCQHQLCNMLVAKYTEINTYYINLINQILIKRAFFHSTDEDKYINYTFISKDNSINSELRKEGITIPAYFKVRDNSYVLEKLRKEYESFSNAIVKMLEMISHVEEKQYIKDISTKQYNYSKQVTILTYLTTFFALFTFIQTFLKF